MKLLNMTKLWSGKILNTYLLSYRNKHGKVKKYEMFSTSKMEHPGQLAQNTRGVAIIAMKERKILFLREFRMAVNRYVYNLVAGTREKDETIEDCIHRELYEETGLKVKQIVRILPPSYVAAALTDMKISFAVVEVMGQLQDHSSENEEIEAKFYSQDEVKELLKTGDFAANCQLTALFFTALK